MTPFQLTRKHLRKSGYVLFSLGQFAGLYAFNPHTQDRIFIQTTTKHNMFSRKMKIMGSKNLPAVLQSGHRVIVHGWQQTDVKTRGKYSLTEMEITL